MTAAPTADLVIAIVRFARFPLLRPSVLLACLLVGTGCTGQDAFAPSPEFFGLIPKESRPAGATLVTGDDCPQFEAPVSPGVRRTIPGSTGTLLLPAGTQVATFGRAPGAALLVPGEGLIGVAFDDAVAVRLGPSDFGRRWPQYFLNSQFQCRVSVGGRDGTLFFDAFGFGPNGMLDAELTLETTTPAGRPVTVTISADRGTTEFPDPPPQPGEQNIAVRRLLARVGTLQW
jgi:hypothetical protein